MKRLQLSVLTSASAMGILHSRAAQLLTVYGEIDREISRHRIGTTGVELYLAMEPDLLHLAKQLPTADGPLAETLSRKSNRPINAVEILAAMSVEQLQRSASLLDQAIRSRDADRTIVAVATFLPEISRSDEMGYPTRQQAVHAMANALRLAAILNRDFKHRIAALEAVTGSRVRILKKTDPAETPTDTEEGSQHTIVLDRPEIVRERMITSLLEAWGEITDNSLRKFAPPIALELEPGPCFLLQDEETLTELARALDGHPKLNGLVGFNLDIAHFRIAKVPLDVVRNVLSIRDRILHAHVSGHHRCAHFGDGIVESGDEQEMRKWLNFLNELRSADDSKRRQQAGFSPYSDYVSLELEATRGAADILESAQRIAEWIP